MKKIPNQAVLSVAHHLFLTKEQRYSLHERKPVEITGSSLPVWFYKGSTSEPAEEVFCNYRITNNQNEKEGVTAFVDNYLVNLPQGVKPNDLLNLIENKEKPKSSRDLLDFKDGGGACLKFRQISSVILNGSKIKIVHFVLIEDIDVLESTLMGNSLD